MITFAKLLMCCVVLLKVAVVFPEIQSRIVGGNLISTNDASFVVRVMAYDLFICGGTLVNPRFVVTVAHYVNGINFEELTVVARATYSFQTGVRSNVSNVLLPKDITSVNVAVLKLHTPIVDPRIQPIGLCTERFSQGDDVQIYGWGKLNKTDKNTSTQLRMATVQVISNKKCRYLYPNRNFLTKTMFCATTWGRKDVCLGDAGGTAVIDGKFCGMILWDDGCGAYKYPGVYIKIKAVRKFIKTAIKRALKYP